MVRSCAAFYCSNKQGQKNKDGNDFTFHKFPLNNESLCRQWTAAVRRNHFQPSKHNVLCSDHFEDSAYYSNYVNRRKLKNDAVPSVFNFPPHLQKANLQRKPSIQQSAFAGSVPDPCLSDVLGPSSYNDHNYTLPASPSKLQHKLNSCVGVMEVEISVHPETVWLQENEAVLAGMKSEVESIDSSSIKSESMMRDIASCQLDLEENTYDNHADVKNEEGSVSPKDCEECSEEVKNEIEIEENSVLEDTSEFTWSNKGSEDISETNGGINMSTTTYKRARSFKCKLCSKSFTVSGSLTTHMRTHTGVKPFKCEVCCKFFIDSSSLSKHTRTHTGVKPFKCEVCSKCFTLSGHLAQHIRTHTGDKPFQCEVCSKRFTQSSGLVQHMRMHTGDKPYKCNVCSKHFTQSGGLIQHMRIHTGDKPYKCNVCSKCFSVSTNLTEHMRTHTGDKPFQCEVCHKRFAASGRLAKHIKIHTAR